MSKFTVYEGSKPAVIDNSVNTCWRNATFDTKREAEIYAYLWCYAVTRAEAEKMAPEMEIGKEYDSGWSEVPILMSIREM